MSFGEGNLRERVAGLEAKNAALLRVNRLLSATVDEQEECLCDRGERIEELESLVRDMWLTWKRLDEAHEWPDPENGVHNGHNGWKTFVKRMRELGIGTEAGES